jgi:hypothetical protein
MPTQPPTLDDVMELVEALSPLERVRLVERVMSSLEQDLQGDNYAVKRSLLGLWQGTVVSDDDIDDARKAMWSDFPREDIG